VQVPRTSEIRALSRRSGAGARKLKNRFVHQTSGRCNVLSLRSSRETIESLRLTLESLDQSPDPAADARELAELKRILLARIADLEMLDALKGQTSVFNRPDEQPAEAPVYLPPLEVVALGQPANEATDTAQMEAGQPVSPRPSED